MLGVLILVDGKNVTDFVFITFACLNPNILLNKPVKTIPVNSRISTAVILTQCWGLCSQRENIQIYLKFISVCHYNSFSEYNLLIVPSPDVSGDEYDDLEYNELIADSWS